MINIPTTEEIKETFEEKVSENQDTLVIATTVIGSAAGLAIGYWMYKKAIEKGVESGIRRALR